MIPKANTSLQESPATFPRSPYTGSRMPQLAGAIWLREHGNPEWREPPGLWHPDVSRFLWREACGMVSLAPPKTDHQSLGLSWVYHEDHIFKK